MIDKTKYLRPTGLAVLWFFIFSCVDFKPVFAANTALEAPQGVVSSPLPADFSSLNIPAAIGDVEFYSHAGKDSVILIQDAHTIPDAQKNIRALIEFFQKNYGINTVALEGADAALDPFMFRSFPDKERLKKVFEDYLQKGELAGGPAAAIFSPFTKFDGGKPVLYTGIEDWPLYENGIRAFLDSDKRNESLKTMTEALREKITQEKKQQFDSRALEMDAVIESFYANGATLPELVKKLGAVKAPEKNSAIESLLEEVSRGEDSAALTSEVKAIAGTVRKGLSARTPTVDIKEGLKELAAAEQDFNLSKTSVQQFAAVLKKLVVKHQIKVKVSRGLSGAARKQQRLENIKGSKLFDELETYIQNVMNELAPSAAAKEVLREARRVRLIETFQRLELSRDQWKEMRALCGEKRQYLGNGVYAGPEKISDEEFKLLKQMEPHYRFYEISDARDQKFLQEVKRLIKGNAGGRLLMVAGGFHARSMSRLFDESNISYALLMPKMENVPAETSYRSQMHGDVSWKNYYQVENGKVNLYKAFVRATRDRLIMSQSHKAARSQGGEIKFSPGDLETGDLVTLKNWRDQMIRDLSAEGRITEASQYTRFIDELNPESPAAKVEKLIAQAKQFTDGLLRLHNEKRLTRENVLSLFQPIVPAMTQVPQPFEPGANLPYDLVGVSSRTVDIGKSNPLGVPEVKAQPNPLDPVNFAALVKNAAAASARSEMRPLTLQEATEAADTANAMMLILSLIARGIDPNKVSDADRERYYAELPLNAATWAQFQTVYSDYPHVLQGVLAMFKGLKDEDIIITIKTRDGFQLHRYGNLVSLNITRNDQVRDPVKSEFYVFNSISYDETGQLMNERMAISINDSGEAQTNILRSEARGIIEKLGNWLKEYLVSHSFVQAALGMKAGDKQLTDDPAAAAQTKEALRGLGQDLGQYLVDHDLVQAVLDMNAGDKQLTEDPAAAAQTKEALRGLGQDLGQYLVDHDFVQAVLVLNAGDKQLTEDPVAAAQTKEALRGLGQDLGQYLVSHDFVQSVLGMSAGDKQLTEGPAAAESGDATKSSGSRSESRAVVLDSSMMGPVLRRGIAEFTKELEVSEIQFNPTSKDFAVSVVDDPRSGREQLVIRSKTAEIQDAQIDLHGLSREAKAHIFRYALHGAARAHMMREFEKEKALAEKAQYWSVSSGFSGAADLYGKVGATLQDVDLLLSMLEAEAVFGQNNPSLMNLLIALAPWIQDPSGGVMERLQRLRSRFAESFFPMIIERIGRGEKAMYISDSLLNVEIPEIPKGIAAQIGAYTQSLKAPISKKMGLDQNPTRGSKGARTSRFNPRSILRTEGESGEQHAVAIMNAARKAHAESYQAILQEDDEILKTAQDYIRQLYGEAVLNKAVDVSLGIGVNEKVGSKTSQSRVAQKVERSFLSNLWTALMTAVQALVSFFKKILSRTADVFDQSVLPEFSYSKNANGVFVLTFQVSGREHKVILPKNANVNEREKGPQGAKGVEFTVSTVGDIWRDLSQAGVKWRIEDGIVQVKTTNGLVSFVPTQRSETRAVDLKNGVAQQINGINVVVMWEKGVPKMEATEPSAPEGRRRLLAPTDIAVGSRVQIPGGPMLEVIAIDSAKQIVTVREVSRSESRVVPRDSVIGEVRRMAEEMARSFPNKAIIVRYWSGGMWKETYISANANGDIDRFPEDALKGYLESLTVTEFTVQANEEDRSISVTFARPETSGGDLGLFLGDLRSLLNRRNLSDAELADTFLRLLDVYGPRGDSDFYRQLRIIYTQAQQTIWGVNFDRQSKRLFQGLRENENIGYRGVLDELYRQLASSRSETRKQSDPEAENLLRAVQGQSSRTIQIKQADGDILDLSLEKAAWGIEDGVIRAASDEEGVTYLEIDSDANPAWQAFYRAADYSEGVTVKFGYDSAVLAADIVRQAIKEGVIEVERTHEGPALQISDDRAAWFPYFQDIENKQQYTLVYEGEFGEESVETPIGIVPDAIRAGKIEIGYHFQGYYLKIAAGQTAADFQAWVKEKSRSETRVVDLKNGVAQQFNGINVVVMWMNGVPEIKATKPSDTGSRTVLLDFQKISAGSQVQIPGGPMLEVTSVDSANQTVTVRDLSRSQHSLQAAANEVLKLTAADLEKLRNEVVKDFSLLRDNLTKDKFSGFIADNFELPQGLWFIHQDLVKGGVNLIPEFHAGYDGNVEAIKPVLHLMLARLAGERNAGDIDLLKEALDLGLITDPKQVDMSHDFDLTLRSGDFIKMSSKTKSQLVLTSRSETREFQRIKTIVTDAFMTANSNGGFDSNIQQVKLSTNTQDLLAVIEAVLPTLDSQSPAPGMRAPDQSLWAALTNAKSELTSSLDGKEMAKPGHYRLPPPSNFYLPWKGKLGESELPLGMVDTVLEEELQNRRVSEQANTLFEHLGYIMSSGVNPELKQEGLPDIKFAELEKSGVPKALRLEIANLYSSLEDHERDGRLDLLAEDLEDGVVLINLLILLPVLKTLQLNEIYSSLTSKNYNYFNNGWQRLNQVMPVAKLKEIFNQVNGRNPGSVRFFEYSARSESRREEIVIPTYPSSTPMTYAEIDSAIDRLSPDKRPNLGFRLVDISGRARTPIPSLTIVFTSAPASPFHEAMVRGSIYGLYVHEGMIFVYQTNAEGKAEITRYSYQASEPDIKVLNANEIPREVAASFGLLRIVEDQTGKPEQKFNPPAMPQQTEVIKTPFQLIEMFRAIQDGQLLPGLSIFPQLGRGGSGSLSVVFDSLNSNGQYVSAIINNPRIYDVAVKDGALYVRHQNDTGDVVISRFSPEVLKSFTEQDLSSLPQDVQNAFNSARSVSDVSESLIGRLRAQLPGIGIQSAGDGIVKITLSNLKNSRNSTPGFTLTNIIALSAHDGNLYVKHLNSSTGKPDYDMIAPGLSVVTADQLPADVAAQLNVSAPQAEVEMPKTLPGGAEASKKEYLRYLELYILPLVQVLLRANDSFHSDVAADQSVLLQDIQDPGEIVQGTFTFTNDESISEYKDELMRLYNDALKAAGLTSEAVAGNNASRKTYRQVLTSFAKALESFVAPRISGAGGQAQAPQSEPGRAATLVDDLAAQVNRLIHDYETNDPELGMHDTLKETKIATILLDKTTTPESKLRALLEFKNSTSKPEPGELNYEGELEYFSLLEPAMNAALAEAKSNPSILNTRSETRVMPKLDARVAAVKQMALEANNAMLRGAGVMPVTDNLDLQMRAEDLNLVEQAIQTIAAVPINFFVLKEGLDSKKTDGTPSDLAAGLRQYIDQNWNRRFSEDDLFVVIHIPTRDPDGGVTFARVPSRLFENLTKMEVLRTTNNPDESSIVLRLTYNNPTLGIGTQDVRVAVTAPNPNVGKTEIAIGLVRSETRNLAQRAGEAFAKLMLEEKLSEDEKKVLRGEVADTAVAAEEAGTFADFVEEFAAAVKARAAALETGQNGDAAKTLAGLQAMLEQTAAFIKGSGLGRQSFNIVFNPADEDDAAAADALDRALTETRDHIGVIYLLLSNGQKVRLAVKALLEKNGKSVAPIKKDRDADALFSSSLGKVESPEDDTKLKMGINQSSPAGVDNLAGLKKSNALLAHFALAVALAETAKSEEELGQLISGLKTAVKAEKLKDFLKDHNVSRLLDQQFSDVYKVIVAGLENGGNFDLDMIGQIASQMKAASAADKAA